MTWIVAPIALGCSFLIDRDNGPGRFTASCLLFVGGMICGYLIKH